MSKIIRKIARQTARKSISCTDNRKRRSIIKTFARKLHLEYIGDVKLKTAHMPIRGFTSSVTHQDKNHVIGKIKTFDIALVDRSDGFWQSDSSIESFRCLVLAIKLHTSVEIPHFFIGSIGHEATIYDKLLLNNHKLKPVALGVFGNYNEEFSSRFQVYAQPAHALQIEKLLSSASAKVLAAHFWPLSVEQRDGCLYLYSYEKQITPHDLKVLLEDGLWLANFLSRQADKI